MSSTIVITQEITSTVANEVELPSYYHGEFNSYVAIIREDLAITVFDVDTTLCSIQTSRPNSLYSNIGRLKPVEKEVFLSAYQKCMALFTDIAITDLNLLP